MADRLTAALAGLLHDVGKFMQRAYRSDKEALSSDTLKMETMLCPKSRTYQGYTHRHVLYTWEFILRELPEDIEGLDKEKALVLASYHHSPSDAEQSLISEADGLSASERERSEDDGEGMRKTRLRSIAASVYLEGKGRGREKAALPLEPLSPGAVFPVEREEGADLTGEYRKLWDEFLAEWRANECRSALDYVNRACSVLERYTSCIPSATWRYEPDVSLFDHLKTTAALAACLAEAGEAEAPFLLVMGDLNGIQNYIFGTGQGAGGQAKRLRARSFQVSAWAESVGLEILFRLGLPLSSRILSAGGKFHLLLPNTEETLSVLRSVKEEVSRRLYDRTDGELGLSLAWVPGSREDIEDFPAFALRCKAALDREKFRPGASVLAGSGGWNEAAFVFPPPRFGENLGLCASCGKRTGKLYDEDGRNVHVCDYCREEKALGRDLTRARWLVWFADDGARYPAPAGSFSLVREGESIPAGARLVVDFEGLQEGPSEAPVVASMRAARIPTDEEGDPLTFEEIAERSTGRKALGWLKMDVDNLGLVFARGLSRDAEEGGTVSRTASLSRMLDVFFSGRIEELVRDEDFSDIYIVYSGGDDLLAVGPWDVMFAFALRVREEFRRFTADNPSLTLSAGVSVETSKTPVLTAVERAEELLEASKSLPGDDPAPWPLPREPEGDAPPRKDRLTAFGVSVPWSRFPAVLQRAAVLYEWLLNKVVSSGQVWRLMFYNSLHRRYYETGDTRYFRYAPLLVRDVRRNWKPGRTEEERDEKERAAEWAASLAATPEAEEMKSLRFVCEYALNAMRSNRKED